MHFKSNSFARKVYLFLTNSFYESLVLIISYTYLLVSVLEPQNHADHPYDSGSYIFALVITIEAVS